MASCVEIIALQKRECHPFCTNTTEMKCILDFILGDGFLRIFLMYVDNRNCIMFDPGRNIIFMDNFNDRLNIFVYWGGLYNMITHVIESRAKLLNHIFFKKKVFTSEYLELSETD